MQVCSASQSMTAGKGSNFLPTTLKWISKDEWMDGWMQGLKNKQQSGLYQF